MTQKYEKYGEMRKEWSDRTVFLLEELLGCEEAINLRHLLFRSFLNSRIEV